MKHSSHIARPRFENESMNSASNHTKSWAVLLADSFKINELTVVFILIVYTIQITMAVATY